jgi:hypothetical protein
VCILPYSYWESKRWFHATVFIPRETDRFKPVSLASAAQITVSYIFSVIGM